VELCSRGGNRTWQSSEPKSAADGSSSMNPNSRTGRIQLWVDDHLLKPLLRSFSRPSERSSRSRSARTPSLNALSVNDPPASTRNPPSTHLQSTHDGTTSAPSPSPLPSPPEQFTSILKTSLNFLKDALSDVPLPGKGAISVAIRIIEIAQVSISSSMNGPVCSYNRSYIDSEG
jgi:hypothetical protein